MPDVKVVAITGASSGIGLCAAKMFADRGYKVYCLSRTAPKDERIKHIPADVSDESAVIAAFERIKSETGRLDVLVNNAGFGISGATELTDTAAAKRQFDVNFFGQFICAKHAAPMLRETKGAIVNVSSAAAIFSIPYQAFYSASKSAINSLTLAMRSELKPFGVRVSAVMPGDVRTGFTAARIKDDGEKSLYSDTIKASVAVMEKDEINGMPPEKVAKIIVKLAEKRRPKPLTVAGGKYKLFAALNKLLPTGLVNSIVGSMYIKKEKK
ncbi:MAG: SDR family oxidoreductase [Clostridia bacterium]|nr:SDR family oxidoreductase [Clostridia bacterium]